MVLSVINFSLWIKTYALFIYQFPLYFTTNNALNYFKQKNIIKQICVSSNLRVYLKRIGKCMIIVMNNFWIEWGVSEF